MMGLQKLPIGIQSFSEIRNNDYLYVDKTEYIWNLVNNEKVYFLSRPRRFGKSLLISTLEEYFRGNKELFRGLFTEKKENEKKEKAWVSCPVIRFSLSGGSYNSENGFEDRLGVILNKYAEEYTIHFEGKTLPARFQELIEQVYAKTGKQIVILVDEYDKHLLETMEVNPEQKERNQILYKEFFGILKDEDQFLRLIFLPGARNFIKSQFSVI